MRPQLWTRVKRPTRQKRLPPPPLDAGLDAALDAALDVGLDADMWPDVATASIPCGVLPNGLSSPRFVDLDGDKVADAFVTVGADSEYSNEVYLKRGSCWMRAAHVRGNIDRMSTVTNGLHDLMTSSACRVPCCIVTHTIYRWNGTSYAAARTWTQREGCLE